MSWALCRSRSADRTESPCRARQKQKQVGQGETRGGVHPRFSGTGFPARQPFLVSGGPSLPLHLLIPPLTPQATPLASQETVTCFDSVPRLGFKVRSLPPWTHHLVQGPLRLLHSVPRLWPGVSSLCPPGDYRASLSSCAVVCNEDIILSWQEPCEDEDNGYGAST